MKITEVVIASFILPIVIVDVDGYCENSWMPDGGIWMQPVPNGSYGIDKAKLIITDM